MKMVMVMALAKESHVSGVRPTSPISSGVYYLGVPGVRVRHASLGWTSCLLFRDSRLCGVIEIDRRGWDQAYAGSHQARPARRGRRQVAGGGREDGRRVEEEGEEEEEEEEEEEDRIGNRESDRDRQANRAVARLDLGRGFD
jgi:hypothetical protein